MYACVCVVVVVGGSRRSTVRVNVSFFPWMLIPPYREDIPAGCVCHVLCIPSQRPTQTPTLSKNSKEIPLSCCFTRWTSVIVAEFPPRHWSSHALTHPSIHQECQRGTNRTKKKNRGIPFFVAMTLFTRRRLGYKNEKCGWITFGALSTRCSNIYETTLWILFFFYDSKFLLMSHRHTRARHRGDRRDFFTLTCINRNNSQGSYITHHSDGLLDISAWCFLANTKSEMNKQVRTTFISEALLVRWSEQSEANYLWSLMLPFFFMANGQCGCYSSNFGKTLLNQITWYLKDEGCTSYPPPVNVYVTSPPPLSHAAKLPFNIPLFIAINLHISLINNKYFGCFQCSTLQSQH